jgi:hypothetical protein
MAIGEAVARDFGEDGIFYGVVTAYRKSGDSGLYTITYTDGVVEDMDLEEYNNYRYAFWLREEGWQAEEGDVPEDPVVLKNAKGTPFFLLTLPEPY